MFFLAKISLSAMKVFINDEIPAFGMTVFILPIFLKFIFLFIPKTYCYIIRVSRKKYQKNQVGRNPTARARLHRLPTLPPT
jgi:hypothetical protein